MTIFINKTQPFYGTMLIGDQSKLVPTPTQQQIPFMCVCYGSWLHEVTLWTVIDASVLLFLFLLFWLLLFVSYSEVHDLKIYILFFAFLISFSLSHSVCLSVCVCLSVFFCLSVCSSSEVCYHGMQT